jgi:hypothetical protein
VQLHNIRESKRRYYYRRTYGHLAAFRLRRRTNRARTHNTAWTRTVGATATQPEFFQEIRNICAAVIPGNNIHLDPQFQIGYFQNYPAVLGRVFVDQ